MLNVRASGASARFTAALFEFFAASARAGIVSTDFRFFPLHGFWNLDLWTIIFRKVTASTGCHLGDDVRTAHLDAAEDAVVVVRTGRGAEEIAQDFDLDAIHEADKQLVGGVLVFDERIFLRVAVVADGIPQAVHFEEVLLPQLIDAVKYDEALEALDLLWIFVIGFDFVGGLRLVDEEVEVFFGTASAELSLVLVESEREVGVERKQRCIGVHLAGLGINAVAEDRWHGIFDDFDDE